MASTEVSLAKRTLSPSDFNRIKLLGKGASGRVYLTRTQVDGEAKVYALKMLSKGDLVERKRVKRVFTELRILQSAKHDFIVGFQTAFHTTKHIYFVLEFCGGGELFRVLAAQDGTCLPEGHVKFYCAEVLLALEHVHSLGYMYRDLKPENILLSNDGHVRIADFDLSARVGASTFGSPQLKRSFVGTPEYLAPEVVTGEGHTQAVDWWGFGVLMFEMLFGATPFTTQSMPETFSKITTEDPVFPEAPRVSPDCMDLIRKLLHKNPVRRLGGRGGAVDIKKHAFFKHVDFEGLPTSTAPLMPKLVDSTDTRYFPNFDAEVSDDGVWGDEDDEAMEGELFFALSAQEEGAVVYGEAGIANQVADLTNQLDRERTTRAQLELELAESKGECKALHSANRTLMKEVSELRLLLKRARRGAARARVAAVGELEVTDGGETTEAETGAETEAGLTEAEGDDDVTDAGDGDGDGDGGGDTEASIDADDYVAIAARWAAILVDTSDPDDLDGWVVVKDEDDVVVDEHALHDSNIVCRRGKVPVRTRVLDVMNLLKESNTLHWGSTVLSSRVVHVVDEDLKIVHFVLKMPLAFSRSRDFCCLLYHSVLPDGTGVRLMRSVEHPGCPEVPEFVRGQVIMAGYVVRPQDAIVIKTQEPFLRNAPTCSVSYVLQVDPRGMIPAWLTNYFMDDHPLHLADIRRRAEEHLSRQHAASVVQLAFRRMITPPPSPVCSLPASGAVSPSPFNNQNIRGLAASAMSNPNGAPSNLVGRFSPRTVSRPPRVMPPNMQRSISAPDADASETDEDDMEAMAGVRASQRQRRRRRRRAMGQAASAASASAAAVALSAAAAVGAPVTSPTPLSGSALQMEDVARRLQVVTNIDESDDSDEHRPLVQVSSPSTMLSPRVRCSSPKRLERARSLGSPHRPDISDRPPPSPARPMPQRAGRGSKSPIPPCSPQSVPRGTFLQHSPHKANGGALMPRHQLTPKSLKRSQQALAAATAED